MRMGCLCTTPHGPSFAVQQEKVPLWCEWLQGHLEFREASGGHCVSCKLFETTVWVGCDSGTNQHRASKEAADHSSAPQGIQESSKQPAAEGNWQFAGLAVHVRQPGTGERCDSCQLGSLIIPAPNNSVYLKEKHEKGLLIIINIKIITSISQCSALN